MPHVIDSSICVSCGVCADACEQGAISEGEDSYVIDPALCNDCDTCASECPSEAITKME